MCMTDYVEQKSTAGSVQQWVMTECNIEARRALCAAIDSLPALDVVNSL